MLGGGALLAQSTAVLLSPLIARLYSPGAFGLYATYMAIVSILALLATAKLEIAIMLPRRHRQGGALLVVLLTSCALSVPFFGLPLILLSPAIVEWIGGQQLLPILWMAPISAFLLGTYQGLRYWAIRRGAFDQVARNTVVRTGLGAILAVLFGLVTPVGIVPGARLVLAQIIAEAAGNYTLLRGIFRRDRALIPPLSRRLLAPARRYGRLALSLTTSQGLATVYEKIPILVIGWLHGPEFAGLYAWAERFAVLPALLAAQAIGDVYRQRAAAEYNQTGRCDQLMRRTMFLAAGLAVVPFSLGIWLAPSVFGWVFGEAWRPAGQIASVLMVGGFVSFVLTPVDASIVICQRGFFIVAWSTTRLLGKVLIAIAAIHYDLSLLTIVWLLVGFRIALYVTSGAYAWHLAKGDRQPILAAADETMDRPQDPAPNNLSAGGLPASAPPAGVALAGGGTGLTRTYGNDLDG
jgi:O-antigen/teichoic acid export membrane protein